MFFKTFLSNATKSERSRLGFHPNESAASVHPIEIKLNMEGQFLAVPFFFAKFSHRPLSATLIK